MREKEEGEGMKRGSREENGSGGGKMTECPTFRGRWKALHRPTTVTPPRVVLKGVRGEMGDSVVTREGRTRDITSRDVVCNEEVWRWEWMERGGCCCAEDGERWSHSSDSTAGI